MLMKITKITVYPSDCAEYEKKMLFWLNVDTIIRPKGNQLLQQQQRGKHVQF
jgi:hypothetical protein